MGQLALLKKGLIANLNQRDMAKQLLTPLRLIASMNFSLKNYSFELFHLTGTVGKVELVSTFTTAVCESWNVSDKYTWDNAGDLKPGLHISRKDRKHIVTNMHAFKLYRYGLDSKSL